MDVKPQIKSIIHQSKLFLERLFEFDPVTSLYPSIRNIRGHVTISLYRGLIKGCCYDFLSIYLNTEIIHNSHTDCLFIKYPILIFFHKLFDQGCPTPLTNRPEHSADHSPEYALSIPLCNRKFVYSYTTREYSEDSEFGWMFGCIREKYGTNFHLKNYWTISKIHRLLKNNLVWLT